MTISDIVYFGDSITSDDFRGKKYPIFIDNVFNIEQYENYSFGGATALLDLKNQVDEYLYDAGGQSKGTLASILIGGNDVLRLADSNFPWSSSDHILDVSFNYVKRSVISTIIESAETLYSAGVETIFIATIPYVNFAMLTPSEADIGLKFTEIFNGSLIESVDTFNLQTEADVKITDIGCISKEVYEDPTAFGFIAPIDISINSYQSENNFNYSEDEFAYYDKFHPSEALQKVFSAFGYVSARAPSVLGTDEDDELSGSAGADLMVGSGGADTMRSGAGGDTLITGLGNDFGRGGRGHDILIGGAGADTLLGNWGADILSGSAGSDILKGNRGSDILIAGIGADMVYGGAGADIFVFIDYAAAGGPTDLAGQAKFIGGQGYDVLYIETDTSEVGMPAHRDLAFNEEVESKFNIKVQGIESIILIDDISEIDFGSNNARVEEADLWGII